MERSEKVAAFALAWHVTDASRLPAILAEGLRAGGYLAVDESIRDYYVETIEEEGGTAVVLEIALARIDVAWLEPDRPGLEEPITRPLGMSEEEVWENWEASDGSWQACAELIGSLRCREAIPSELVCVLKEGGPAPA